MTKSGFLPFFLLVVQLIFSSHSSADDQTMSSGNNDDDISRLTTDQCLQLGFDRNVLQCEKCAEFGRFDLDEIGSHECVRCCTQMAGVDQQKRFPKARLEMCNCKLGYYPQIQAFTKSSRPTKFKGLTIKHIPGAEPIIKLLDENDTTQEKLSIQKWDTDTIEEFLKERLW